MLTDDGAETKPNWERRKNRNKKTRKKRTKTAAATRNQTIQHEQ